MVAHEDTISIKNVLTGQIYSKLSTKHTTFTANTGILYGISSIAAEYIDLQNGNIILKITGSMYIKSDLTRNDILGHFDFPYNIEDVNIVGYEDAVTTDDAQVIVVFTIRYGRELTTRGKPTAGRWIGFLGIVLAIKQNE